MPPLAHPGGSPLVLHAGKADVGGCRAQSSVSAVKAAGALGKLAAARDVPSSGRERGGGFISGHSCMEALWHKGSSPGPPLPPGCEGRQLPYHEHRCWSSFCPLRQPRRAGTQGSW